MLVILLLLQSSCYENKKNKQEVSSINDEEQLDKQISSNIDIYELDYENREFPGVNGFKQRNCVVSKNSMYYFDFMALQSIVNDSNSYTTIGSACFYPNIAVVVTDEKSKAVSELYICLHCNNYEVYGNDDTFVKVRRKDDKYGFSKRARKKIRNLIKSYGFTTKHTYSLLYDYPKDYLEHQIRNGLDSVDVMKDILEHYTYLDYDQTETNLDAISAVGWIDKSADFFEDRNIGKTVYEYDLTGGDRFTTYLGKINIDESTYYVCNLFRRVQAAIVLHGHSSLYFLDEACEVVAKYSISFPDELPKRIINNKLEFEIKGHTYLVEDIDLSLPYLCIKQETLCVSKIE